MEWTEEENYKFRLSAMQDQLLAFYEANPDFIVPKVRYESIMNSVREGLKDLSISRPSSRLSWALKVPGDSEQTIYVWLDALVNYITKAGFPWTPGEESALGWPADVHVIGKDIMRFVLGGTIPSIDHRLTDEQLPLHPLARLPLSPRYSAS